MKEVKGGVTKIWSKGRSVVAHLRKIRWDSFSFLYQKYFRVLQLGSPLFSCKHLKSSQEQRPNVTYYTPWDPKDTGNSRHISEEEGDHSAVGTHLSCCNLGKHREQSLVLHFLLMLGPPSSCLFTSSCSQDLQLCWQPCAKALSWELHLNRLQVTAERLQASSPQAMRCMEVFKQSWFQRPESFLVLILLASVQHQRAE